MAPVVDAHHHLLDPERVDYHFLQFLPDLRRRLSPADLAPLLEDAGVTHSVCVQAADCEDETAFMLSEADTVDWIAGVVGWLPLTDPAATASALETHRTRATRLRGVRHLLQDEPDDDWLVGEAVVESLGLLAADGLVFDVSAFNPRHIAHVTTLAERVPDLDLVLCHFGMPKLHEGEWEPWASAFAAAATNPRCHVKLSGLDMYAGGCDPDRFRRYFDHAASHFGPERMLWASNWPVSLQLKGYAELLTTARHLLADLSPPEADAVFGGNANRVYRLGIL